MSFEIALRECNVGLTPTIGKSASSEFGVWFHSEVLPIRHSLVRVVMNWFLRIRLVFIWSFGRPKLVVPQILIVRNGVRIFVVNEANFKEFPLCRFEVSGKAYVLGKRMVAF